MAAIPPNSSDQNLYTFLEDYIRKHRISPSYQEMVDGTAAKSKGHIHAQLNNLEKAGWIERLPNKPRTIKLLRKISSAIPLAGVIQAGEPIHIPDSSSSPFSADEAIEVGDLLPESARRKQLYALRVEGDSMIDSNVQEGDLVIMEKVSEVNNGQMVAAWLTGKELTTLKHFYKEKGKIRLQPANAAYEPQIYDLDEVQIHGRVVLVVRTC